MHRHSRDVSLEQEITQVVRAAQSPRPVRKAHADRQKVIVEEWNVDWMVHEDRWSHVTEEEWNTVQAARTAVRENRTSIRVTADSSSMVIRPYSITEDRTISATEWQ